MKSSKKSARRSLQALSLRRTKQQQAKKIASSAKAIDPLNLLVSAADFAGETLLTAAPNLPAATEPSSPDAPAKTELKPAAPLADSSAALACNALDIKVLAAMARASSSISPMSMLLAGLDWAGHLAMAPGKRIELLNLALQQIQDTVSFTLESYGGTVEEAARDRRFSADAWQMWPFNYWYRNFLTGEAWWKAATHNIPGLTQQHQHVVSFVARQILDTLSPANYLMTNPLILQKTLASGGRNLVRGYMNMLQDIERQIAGHPPLGAENFIPGQAVAVTAGKVVLRNALIELIQYAPITEQVRAEPILIVPAWIMKYYILDLSPHNSLVKYLLEQGHTVFCISWKNPGIDEAALGMDDYLRLGILAALDAIAAIVPQQHIHAAGYCLGGTLLAIAAAALARDGDDRLASMTLFTAQTSFSEPGELALFIDESQVSMLEAQMQETGFLTAGQMAAAFQLLRSYDLLWSKMVNEYLLGERRSLNDLMAWNADATRMPARMHAEYLRHLFLNDDLAQGRYQALGQVVRLSDLRLPIFCVATLTDHVAPWSSVYKLHYLTAAELTFVLSNGGHTAGIINDPARKNRRYQLLCRAAGDVSVTPADWLSLAPSNEGSWWDAWAAWLAAHSSAWGAPPPLGSADYPVLADAPGLYVFEK